MAPLLSILIPVYNEEEFIRAVLERVLAAPLPRNTGHASDRELIVVDDASAFLARLRAQEHQIDASGSATVAGETGG